MSQYRVALIGTGRVGWQFDFDPELPDNHAAAVQASGRCQLVAGVNRGRGEGICRSGGSMLGLGGT